MEGDSMNGYLAWYLLGVVQGIMFMTGFTITKSGFVVTSNYDRATRWLETH